MKKVLYLLLGILALSLYSCTSEDTPPLPRMCQAPTDSSELLKALKCYNDSLSMNNNCVSRDFWQTTLRIGTVASADIAGAYELGKIGASIGSVFGPQGAAGGAAVGGLIGGAGASYGAYCTTESMGSTESTSFTIPAQESVIRALMKLKEDRIDINLYYPNEIIIDLPTNSIETMAIGAKHNAILDYLSEGNLSSTPLHRVLNNFEVSILNSPEFRKAYKEILLSYDLYDYTTFIINDATVADSVMRLYLESFNTSVKKHSDVESISKRYVSEVQKSSELTSNQKELIYISVSVAASSYERWAHVFK